MYGGEPEGCRLLTSVALPRPGHVKGGVTMHPNGKTMIYALGNNVVVATSQGPVFLEGHTGEVTCTAISPSGRYLASGQSTAQGSKVGNDPPLLSLGKRPSRTVPFMAVTQSTCDPLLLSVPRPAFGGPGDIRRMLSSGILLPAIS